MVAAKIKRAEQGRQSLPALSTMSAFEEQNIMSERDSIRTSSEKPVGFQKTHGEFGTRLYKVWESMKQRCLNPNCKAFHNYGGRGISVCSEWMAYVPFRDWARMHGYSDDLEIDRIDNDGNYEPGNVRWVTAFANSRNRRNTWTITAFGETKCLTDWVADDRCVIGRTELSRRIKRGVRPEEAITTAECRKYVLRNRKRDVKGRVLPSESPTGEFRPDGIVRFSGLKQTGGKVGVRFEIWEESPAAERGRG